MVLGLVTSGNRDGWAPIVHDFQTVPRYLPKQNCPSERASLIRLCIGLLVAHIRPRLLQDVKIYEKSEKRMK